MCCEQTLAGCEQRVKKSRVFKGSFHSQKRGEFAFRKVIQTSNFRLNSKVKRSVIGEGVLYCKKNIRRTRIY